ncbi:MAG: endolytic transglycosylase MltG [Endomicrobium sp.]|nr:endolytic transglycosylase MltG [Endomicrobium sp.]
MTKKIIIELLKTIILLLVLVFIIKSVFLSNEKILLNVQKGDSSFTIASHLKEKNLILSRKLFIILSKITNFQNKLKIGVYSFSKKDGMFKILWKLKTGSNNILQFTIPEGSNIKQIADIISKVINIDKKKFVQIATDRNLEGYLMPETYFVSLEVSEEQLIEIMRTEFDRKITQDMYKRAAELNISFEDIIIMASIIEKEAANSEERSIVAAVFYNRLKKKIKLQSCATVLYAMGVNKVKLTAEDVKFESLYNTYVYYGLPPGPISNPGIESIKAALYPANTENLFFVSSGNGKHLFAKDFNEHTKNKQRLKLKRQK